MLYLRYQSKKSYFLEEGTKRIKMIIKVTSYLVIIVMFLYQHIMEVLLYGIIEVIFSYIDKSKFREGYEMYISGNEKYIFFGFNIIFFICMKVIRKKIQERLDASDIDRKIDTVVNSYLQMRETK